MAEKKKLIIVKKKTTEVPPMDDLLSFPLLDLRTCGGLHNTLESNQKLLQMFDELIAYYTGLRSTATGDSKTRQQQRINSFMRARDSIKDCPFPVTSGVVAQKLKGIGKGIADRIDEYLKTGKLKEMEGAVSDKSHLIAELCTVTGIGEARASTLIKEYHVTSLADLITRYKSGGLSVGKNQLTNHIAVGLQYYDDFQERFPWSEAHALAEKARMVISRKHPGLQMTFCGSYRRKKETCGDLDVVICDSRLKTAEEAEKDSPLSDIVRALTDDGFLVADLTSAGKTLYMGVCRLGEGAKGRRIDIRFVPATSVGAAILYFTGSGKFNKVMRHMANTRGYTLNEYGLYTYLDGVKGEHPIPAMAEQDIFDILGFVYLTPEEREFGSK